MAPVSDDVYFPLILMLVLRGQQCPYPHFVDGGNEAHMGQALPLLPWPVSSPHPLHALYPLDHLSDREFWKAH